MTGQGRMLSKLPQILVINTCVVKIFAGSFGHDRLHLFVNCVMLRLKMDYNKKNSMSFGSFKTVSW